MIQKIADLPQQQQVMLAIVAVGSIFLFWFYMISPIGGEIERLDGDIQRLTVEVEQAQAAAATKPQFEQEVQELEQRLAQEQEALPDQKETAEIVRRVEQLAVESNLDVRSFRPQATVPRDFYEDWPILIALEGNYNNLGLFFQKVALFPRIINVDNIEIRTLGGGSPDQNRTISASCRATTFVFVEEEAS